MDSVRVVHEGTWLYPSGAERVAREIARALDAPVTVGHSGDPEFWSDVDATFPFQSLNRRPLSWLPRGLKELYLGLAFRTLSFEEDVVVSSGTTAKWWSPRSDQRHVHYCHSPPVRVFVEPAGNVLDAASRTGIGIVDRFFADQCDEILSNSAFTADRVSTYYDRESRVVNPPVETDRFYNETPAEDPHFVMVGRLDEMKRADVVARAFENLDATLKLVGDGPLRRECANRRNVDVLGTVPDEELRELVATAKGGIAFARKEHCGMTPKEFQAAGKPVVVPDEPNLVNHVVDGETGVVVEPTEAGVREGIERVLAGNWEQAAVRRAAEEWSVERFRDEIRDVVPGDVR
jgi:glycosyltransferase involved in cell wall biosynthesis